MTAAYRATGAWTSGTANLIPAIPTGTVAGDIMLCFYATKPHTDVATISAGWRLVHQVFSGSIVAGSADSGSVQFDVYYKEHSGTESAPTITNTTNSVSGAVIISYSKDAAKLWAPPDAFGGYCGYTTAFSFGSAVYPGNGGRAPSWYMDGQTTSGAVSVAFKPDGSAMFVGHVSGMIYQFTLNTPYDVSSAVYDSKSYQVSNSWQATGMSFSPDGLNMYLAYAGYVRRHSLSTAWDITTCVQVGAFKDISTNSSVYCRHVAFKADGTRMLAHDPSNNRLVSYTLNTAWDVSTLVYTSQVAIGSYVYGMTYGQGFAVSADGTKVVFRNGGSGDSVDVYTLGTPWVASSGTYTSAEGVNLTGMSARTSRLSCFNDTGNKIFLTDETRNAVWQFDLGTAWAANTTKTYPVLQSGDMIAAYAAMNTDSATQSGFVIAAPGATLGTFTESPAADLATTSGYDMAMSGGYATVTAGPSTAAPEYSSTLAAVAEGCGAIIVLRDRSNAIFKLGAATASGAGTMSATPALSAKGSGAGTLFAVGRLESDPVGNGFIYSGTYVDATILSTLTLSFSTETWQDMNTTPAIKKQQFGATSSSDAGWIFGGYTGVMQTDILRFEFSTGTTRAATNQLPSGNYSQHCSTYNTLAYVLAGQSGLQGGYRFTFSTESLASLPTALTTAGVWRGGGSHAVSREATYVNSGTYGYKYQFATETDTLYGTTLAGYPHNNSAACDGYVAVFVTAGTNAARGLNFGTDTTYALANTWVSNPGDTVSSNHAGYIRDYSSLNVQKINIATGTYSTMTGVGVRAGAYGAAFSDMLKFNLVRPYVHPVGAATMTMSAGFHLAHGVGQIVSGYYNNYANNYADTLNFLTRTSAGSSANLAVPRMYTGAGADAWKGYVFGGYDAFNTFGTIDGVDLFSLISLPLQGALATPRRYPAVLSAHAKGYVCLGQNSTGNDVTTIDSYLWGAAASTTISATFVQPRTTAATAGDASKGYVTGTNDTTIEKLTYATETRSVIAGQLIKARQIGGCADSKYEAFFVSGYQSLTTPNYITLIDSLNFATEATAQESALATPERYGGASASGRDEGVVAGGANSLGQSIATINAVAFSTRVYSTWGTNLSYQRSYAVGLATLCEGPYAKLLGQCTLSKPPSRVYIAQGTGYFVGHPSVVDGPYGLHRSTTRIHFATDTQAPALCTATTNYVLGANCNSETYGYILGSAGKARLHFVVETYEAVAATITHAASGPACGASDKLYGYIVGSSSGGVSRWSFATQTETTFAGVFPAIYQQAVAFGPHQGAFGYKSVYSLLASPYTQQTAIDKVTWGTMTATLSVTALSAARRMPGCGSGATQAMLVGGYDGTTQTTTVHQLLYSTDTCTVAGSALGIAMSQGSTVSSPATGWHAGGASNASPGLYASNAIDKLTYSTAAVATASHSLTPRNQTLVAGVFSQGGAYGGPAKFSGVGGISVTYTHIPGVRVSMVGAGTAAATGTHESQTPKPTLAGTGTAAATAAIMYAVAVTASSGVNALTATPRVVNTAGYAYSMAGGGGYRFSFDTYTSNLWAETATAGPSYSRMIASTGNRGYWAGGIYQYPMNDAVPTGTIYRGDLATQTITPVGSLVAARGGGAYMHSPSNAYFFGGQTGHTYVGGIDTYSSEIDGMTFASESVLNPAATISSLLMRQAYTVAGAAKGFGYYDGGSLYSTPGFSWVFATQTFGAAPQTFAPIGADKAATVNAYGAGYIFDATYSGHSFGEVARLVVRKFDFSTETYEVLTNKFDTFAKVGHRTACASADTAFLFNGSNAASYGLHTNTFTDLVEGTLPQMDAYVSSTGFTDNNVATMGNAGALVSHANIGSSTGQGYSFPGAGWGNPQPNILHYNSETFSRSRVNERYVGNYVGGASTSAYGYLFGGQATCASFSFIISTDTARSASVTFSVGRDAMSVPYNLTKAYLVGGRGRVLVGQFYYDTYLDSTESFTFSTETTAALSAVLKAGRDRLTTLQSGTKGYACMGTLSGVGFSNEIESFVFSTETTGDPTAAFGTSRTGAAGVYSTTKGFVCGGYNGSAYQTAIDTLVFSSEAAGTSASVVSTSPYAPTGLRSSTKGYLVGGEIHVAEGYKYITFSNEAVASLSTTLPYFSDGRDANMGVSYIPGSTETHFGGALLNGVGSATAVTGPMTYGGSASCVGAGAAAASGMVPLILYGVTTAAGIGAATAAGSVGKTWYGQSTPSGVGAVTAAGKVEKFGAASLSGAGVVVATAARLAYAITQAVGSGSVEAQAALSFYREVAAVGDSGLHCVGSVTAFGQATGAGVGALDAYAVLRKFSTFEVGTPATQTEAVEGAITVTSDNGPLFVEQTI